MSTNILVCAACALMLVIAGPSGRPAQDRRVIHVTAERYAFTPSHVKVKRGTEVEFRLTSEDTNHGFRIRRETSAALGTATATPLGAGDANVIIPKRGRGEAVLIFRADTTGRYTFGCSKMCGAGHAFMRGLITVED
jgi:cytochrome c oxidase subunit II